MIAGSHADVWGEWRAALAGDRMHHAWMLAGQCGSGKAAFALSAAAELVGAEQGATPDIHPDLLHLRREAKKAEEGKPFELRRNITVAQIRGMQRRLITRPTLGSRRAIVIDPADDLEPGAANALLKSLEEPPLGTFFLLVAHHPARLLPTIRSRCRVLRFGRKGALASSETGDEVGHIAEAVGGVLEGVGNASASLQKLGAALGSRPSRAILQSALHQAQDQLAASLHQADAAQFSRIDSAYAELCRLDAELVSYNYDPDLLAARIGTLLSGVTARIGGHNG